MSGELADENFALQLQLQEARKKIERYEKLLSMESILELAYTFVVAKGAGNLDAHILVKFVPNTSLRAAKEICELFRAEAIIGAKHVTAHTAYYAACRIMHKLQFKIVRPNTHTDTRESK
jgi:hypothetical protein